MDWSPLSHDDPLPGDVAAIDATGRRFQDLADAVSRLGGRALRIDLDAVWSGLAAQQFADARNRVPRQLRALSRRCGLAGQALTRWAGDVDVHQAHGRVLRDRARQAQADIAVAAWELYADLYARNPDQFLWAGMATLAGGTFYGAFQDVHVLRRALEDGSGSADRVGEIMRHMYPGLPGWVYQQFAGLAARDLRALATEVRFVEVEFLHMQRLIFDDLGPRIECPLSPTGCSRTASREPGSRYPAAGACTWTRPARSRSWRCPSTTCRSPSTAGSGSSRTCCRRGWTTWTRGRPARWSPNRYPPRVRASAWSLTGC